jgi:signal transduction histidine kinase
MELIEVIDSGVTDAGSKVEQLCRKEQSGHSVEQSYKSLFTAMGTPAAIYKAVKNGKDFIFTDFNTAAEQADNLSKSSVIGRSIVDVFPKTKSSGLVEVFTRVYETGNPEKFNIKLFKDDVVVGFRNNFVYKLPDGQIVSVYSCETARNKTDQQLIAHRQRLRELTSELSLSEERQRRRIAANLHDQLSQWLAISIMKLGLVKDALDDETAEEIDDISDTIGKAIDSVRSLIYDLSSPTLYRFGLEAAVFEYITTLFKKHDDICCEFVTAKETVELEEDVNVLIFQSVRELLFNIIKYAKASHVVVDMKVSGDYYQVRVCDDGVGFDVSTIGSLDRSGGFGLFHMSERLDHVGGKLDIESEPGKGSSFCLRLPLVK